MKITKLKLATFVILLLNFTHSQAISLQVIDDEKWGTNSIIYDPTTGLDWLKPINTVNKSFNFISSQLGLGDYLGFSYAEHTLIAELFTDAGLPILNTPQDNFYQYNYSYPKLFIDVHSKSIEDLQLTSLNSIINVFGATSSGTVQVPVVAGLTSDIYNPLHAPSLATGNFIAFMVMDPYGYSYNVGISIGTQRYGGNYLGSDLTSDWVGSWLVRTHVPVSSKIPESSTNALFATGLIGLALSRRKKYQV